MISIQRKLARNSTVALLLLGVVIAIGMPGTPTAPSKVRGPHDYVPGEPHYSGPHSQQSASAPQRPLTEEGELLVRVSSVTPRGVRLMAAESSALEIKRVLADRVTDVRSLFKFTEGSSRSAKGVSALQTASSREWLSLSLRTDDDANAACQTLQSGGIADACQKNFRHYVNALPNDAFLTEDRSTFASCAFGQLVKNLWGHEMIRAFEAWNAPGCPEGGCKGQGVVVGVVDSGIDYTHPDIVSSLYVNPDEDLNQNGVFDPYPADQGGDLDGVDGGANSRLDDVVGTNFVDGSSPPYDELGHGTHCAGTIGATAGNGIGIAGIAPQAKILTAKAISKHGYGTSAWLAQGLRYIVDTVDRDRDGRVDQPTVINNSWGSDSDAQDLLLEDATKYAIAKGAVVVFAAGNSNDDAAKRSPNALPEAIMVAAVSPQAGRAEFSNFGDRVAVAAPGGGGYSLDCSKPDYALPDASYNIISLLAANSVFSRNLAPYVVGEKYIRLAGTSMAAPHVAGVVALLLSQRPYLTPAQVRNILLAGTRSSIDYKYAPYTGTGIVDAVKVLSLPDDLNLSASFDRTEHEITSARTDYPVNGDTRASKTEILLTKIKNNKVIDQQVLSTIIGPEKGALGVIDPQTFSGQDEFWIEMKTSSGDYSATTRRRMYFDPSLRVGYPTKVINSRSTGGGFYIVGQPAPIVADLSGNGEARLVLKNPKAGIVIADTRGKVLRNINGISDQVYVADLNGDGLKQIFGLGPWDRIYTAEGDPVAERSMWGWSSYPNYTEYKGSMGGASIGIVGNLRSSVVAQLGEIFRWYPSFEAADRVTITAIIYLLDGNLKDLPGWEGGKVLPEGEKSPVRPLIGDLNGDGLSEVIVGPTNQGNVRLFSLDGALISQFKVDLGQSSINASAFGDLDRDGKNELIFTTADTLHAVHADGSELAGWPVKLSCPYDDKWNVSIVNIGLADLNGDGHPEVVGSGFQLYSIFAIQYDGKALPGWATMVADIFGVNEAPVVGQVDGSGKQNVVFRDESSGTVTIVNSNGVAINDLTKRMNGAFVTMPVIADVDGDGGNEIVAVNEDGALFVWDTKGSACEVSEWTTLGGDVSLSYRYSTPRQAPYVYGCGATLGVKIVGADERPISGVVVDGGRLGKRTSGADGIVRFGGLPLGLPYGLSFAHTAYGVASISGDVRGDELRTVRGTVNTQQPIVATPKPSASPLGTVTGRVIDQDGAPIYGAIIDAGVCGKAFSDADGRFIFQLLKYGTQCIISASREGVSFPNSSSVFVSGGNAEIAIVGTKYKYSLSGRISHKGKPISGATVSASTGVVKRSSKKGYFEFKGIEYGTRVNLTVSARRYKKRMMTVAMTADKRITVSLRR